MRLLIVSDTHGYLAAALRVHRERGPWDHLIHLGDSAADAAELALELGVDVMALRGNNEYPGSPEYGDELIFTAEGVKFYAVHGHELDLNHWDGEMEKGLMELRRRAREAGARAALCGHTHYPLLEDRDGVLVLNPGAMSLGDKKRTYGEIVVESGGIFLARVEDAGC
jgi:hypothetical protein